MEWTPKTNVLVLANLKGWMDSGDMEVLGFVDALNHDRRFCIAPPFPIADYVRWAQHYYGEPASFTRLWNTSVNGSLSAGTFRIGCRIDAAGTINLYTARLIGRNRPIRILR